MRVERTPDPSPYDSRLAAPTTPQETAKFADALRAQLRAAQAEALVSGLSGSARSDAGRASSLSTLLESLQRQLLDMRADPALTSEQQPLAASDDPYGWRAMARDIGERIVGGGFGTLFERQIQQESGFSPDIVLGQRLSTAGAEGIAQLMPQFYPNVNRLDPREALTTAATTMSDYLSRYGGDIRKALAAYNAGPGRVNQLVAALGANWEAGLPAETKGYLQTILSASNARRGSSASSRLLLPASGAITQEYHDGHSALDIGANSGAPIRASADGRVVSVQKLDDGYGWHVVVDHGGGLQTLYAHASAMHVRPGQQVRRGQVIAEVGSTGKSTGPHLHYEVRRNGVAVDPTPYLR